MNEDAFRQWYAKWSGKLGLDPNPYNPLHYYDYRAAYEAGAEPDEEGHWPSEFKRVGHPNLIVGGIDTRTGKPVTIMEDARTLFYKSIGVDIKAEGEPMLPTTTEYVHEPEQYKGVQQEEMFRILGLMRPRPHPILTGRPERYEQEPVLTSAGLKYRIKGLEPLTGEEYGELPQAVKTELEAFFGEVPAEKLSKLKTPADVRKIEELVGIEQPWFLDPTEWVAGGAVGVWKTPVRHGLRTVGRELAAEMTMGGSELVRGVPRVLKGAKSVFETTRDVLKKKPEAEFIGFQETAAGGRVPLFNVGKDTMTVEGLQRRGIPVPELTGEEGFIDIQGKLISRGILSKSRELQERLGIRKYIIPRVDDLDKETRMLFLGHRARMAERRGEVAKAVAPLRDLNEEELNYAYKWLTIDNDYALADELGIPSSELYTPKWKNARDAAVKIRNAFVDLGLEATKTPAAFAKSLLKEDTYYKNLMTYLPDMAYVKEYPHLFGPDMLDLTNASHRRKFRTDLSRFMKNKGIIKRHKEDMLQILDVRYLSSKGLLQVTQEIETAKLYNSLGEIPGNVFDDIDHLTSFQNQFRESFERAGLDVEDSLKKMNLNREAFIRVPNEPEYLGLSGKLVRRDIGDALSDMRPEQLDKMSRLMDSFLNPWRVGKVVLRPATHGRNLLSNLMLNDIGGLPFYRMDVYGRALKDLYHKGKYYQLAREKGLLLPTYSHEEMGRLYSNFTESGGMGELFNKITKPATDLYQAEEQWFKLSKFMYHMEHDVPAGRMDVDDAILAALESTFDYSTRAVGQSEVRRWAMPFATWTYKSLPYLSRMSVEHPLRVGKWLLALGALSHYSAEKVLGSKEEWRELYKRMPNWQRGKNLILLPIRDKEGRLQLVDLTYMLPWGDVAELQSQKLGRMLQNPIVSTIADLTRNRDFADREIVPSYERGELEGYMKQMFHAYKQLTPSGFPGNYDWQMIAETIGKPGEPRTKTPAQAAMAMMGLKINPMTEREIKLGYLDRHEVERNQLIADWNRDVSNEPRASKRNEIIKKYRDKLHKLDEEHRQRLRREPPVSTPAFIGSEAKRFILP